MIVQPSGAFRPSEPDQLVSSFRNARCTEDAADTLVCYYFLPWYFIPRMLKLAKAKMYARNGYLLILDRP